MKVLNISSNDLMGSRFNGYDVHDRLAEAGIDTQLACFWNHLSDKPWVFNPFPGKFTKLAAELTRALEHVTGFQNRFQFWSRRLLSHKSYVDSDLVHLQVIHDHFMRFDLVSKISEEKPTLWTWHDLWPVTGHCISPEGCPRWSKGCGSCPDLAEPLPVLYDRTKKEYSRKVGFLSDLNLDIHVSTKWMEQRIQPFVMSNPRIRIHRFPFGVDTQLFSERPRDEIRKLLGLGSDDFVIFARATADRRKGFIPLIRALDALAEVNPHIVLITVQGLGLAEGSTTNLRVLEFPWSNSPDELVNLYSACDIFAMPSYAESFGMMALEAMSCSRPVITCQGTATAEIVEMPELEVRWGSLEKSLVQKLSWAIEKKEFLGELGKKSRDRAEELFSDEKYVEALSSAYSKVLERRKK